jgi:hypothetical protein
MKPRGRIQTLLFWCGLAGILVTGVLMVTGGVDAYFIGGLLSFTKWGHRSWVLLLLIPVLVAVFDLVAFGMILAGSVVLSRRLRVRLNI